MKKLLLSIFLGVGLSVSAQSTKTYGGVKFPTTIEIGKTSLELNGGGIREKYFMDLYAAGLYLSKKTDDAGKIIYGDSEQAIHIKIISSMVTREKFIESTTEGFKNAGHGKATDADIKKFMGFFPMHFSMGGKGMLRHKRITSGHALIGLRGYVGVLCVGNMVIEHCLLNELKLTTFFVDHVNG